MWPLVRSTEQVDELIRAVLKSPGVVLHSLVIGNVRSYLIEQCKLFGIPQICPIEGIISMISEYINLRPDKNIPGKSAYSNEDYLKKIDSINFAITHDDGQNTDDYCYADIVILGVSRTSKSPTSFYLAYRGYKVANLPIVSHVEYEKILSTQNPLFIGLSITPHRLLEVRKSRIYDLTGNEPTTYLDDYLSLTSIRDEICYANKLFTAFGIQVLDVTTFAVEELAAKIISIFCARKGSHVIN